MVPLRRLAINAIEASLAGEAVQLLSGTHTLPYKGDLEAARHLAWSRAWRDPPNSIDQLLQNPTARQPQENPWSSRHAQSVLFDKHGERLR
jgi:hypothetical protein